MPRLIEPGPNPEQMALLEAAALRAPDHMQLMPYQFQCFEGPSRARLSTLFAEAASQKGEPEAGVNKAAQLPFRAPLVIAAVMKHQAHDKVPRVEQICTTACAAMAIEQAAFAQGLGAI
ncbi:nitroreductase, partial [Thalassospira xiamenensis]